MKPGKLEQIRRVRLQARALHDLAHVQACACCQYDADAIETLADTPCAPSWLAHVAKRALEMAHRPSGQTPRKD